MLSGEYPSHEYGTYILDFRCRPVGRSHHPYSHTLLRDIIIRPLLWKAMISYLVFSATQGLCAGKLHIRQKREDCNRQDRHLARHSPDRAA
jgi:hypothetical protein